MSNITRTRLAPGRSCQAMLEDGAHRSATATWLWQWEGGAEAEFCDAHDREAASFNPEIAVVHDPIITGPFVAPSTVEATRVMVADVLVRVANWIRPLAADTTPNTTIKER